MTVHEEWLNKLKTFPPSNLILPPPTLNELMLEYLEIIPGHKMTAKFPFQKRFTNPMGVFQGGILTACVDEVFGPLSYLTAAGPTMTLSMNTTYLGSFKEEFGYCLIHAEVLKKTKNFIFMRADIKTSNNELIAHSESHVKIL
jgi:uncharacterized protein (TIGR00369 family)